MYVKFPLFPLPLNLTFNDLRVIGSDEVFEFLIVSSDRVIKGEVAVCQMDDCHEK
jgi:hypothetical protein